MGDKEHVYDIIVPVVVDEAPVEAVVAPVEEVAAPIILSLTAANLAPLDEEFSLKRAEVEAEA
jgi:hypothetical protein